MIELSVLVLVDEVETVSVRVTVSVWLVSVWLVVDDVAVVKSVVDAPVISFPDVDDSLVPLEETLITDVNVWLVVVSDDVVENADSVDETNCPVTLFPESVTVELDVPDRLDESDSV